MAKDKIKGLRPETLAVAFGYDPEMGMGSVKPPIFMTSTFVYPSTQHAKDVHEAYFDGTEPRVAASDSERPKSIWRRECRVADRLACQKSRINSQSGSSRGEVALHA